MRECIDSVGAHKEVTEADRSEAADVVEEQVKGMVTGADVAMLVADKQVTVAAVVAAVVS